MNILNSPDYPHYSFCYTFKIKGVQNNYHNSKRKDNSKTSDLQSIIAANWSRTMADKRETLSSALIA